MFRPTFFFCLFLSFCRPTDQTLTNHIDGKHTNKWGLPNDLVLHVLPFHARLLFYNSVVLPIFDYVDLVWGDKNNVTIMMTCKLCRIRRQSLYWAGTDAFNTLKWLNLGQRRLYHCCLYVHKCPVNGLSCHSMELLRHGNVHGYNTRNKGHVSSLARVKSNWGNSSIGCSTMPLRTGTIWMKILEVQPTLTFLNGVCAFFICNLDFRPSLHIRGGPFDF